MYCNFVTSHSSVQYCTIQLLLGRLPEVYSASFTYCCLQPVMRIKKHKYIYIFFSDTKNNTHILCLHNFKFLCLPPYQTFDEMQPAIKIYIFLKEGSWRTVESFLILMSTSTSMSSQPVVRFHMKTETIRDLIPPRQIGCFCIFGTSHHDASVCITRVCMEKQSIYFVQTENIRPVS